jgi:hypothetical protein
MTAVADYALPCDDTDPFSDEILRDPLPFRPDYARPDPSST